MCCSYTSAARPIEVIGSGLQTTHLVPLYPEEHLSPGNNLAQPSSMLLLLIARQPWDTTMALLFAEYCESESPFDHQLLVKVFHICMPIYREPIAAPTVPKIRHNQVRHVPELTDHSKNSSKIKGDE